MDWDSYLAEAARAMIAAAARSRSVVRVLQQRCPSIHRQLRQLRGCRPLRQLWGHSCNVDANARQIIVHPAILDAIGRLAGIPLRGQIVHAGLEHTYGYLFSLLETPYGYKRERWTEPTIEDGFGIAVPTLRAEPAAGTLLTNLTWLAGQIAFRDRPGELRLLQQTADLVSPVLRHYPFTGLVLSRVVEEASVPAPKGERSVRLQTDLVPFPRPPASSEVDNHLLIYSVITGKRARLITVFPVTQTVVEEWLAFDKPQGVRETLPYNAYVRGLSGRPFQVRRHVHSAGRL